MSNRTDIDALLDGWQGRPTVAVIDLDALAGNIRAFRAHIGPDPALMAVVKADGYGHGATPIAKAAIAAGANELGVATVDEGVRLRDAGIEAPILVLGPIGTNERPRAIAHNLALVVADIDFARGLETDKQLLQRESPVPVHLKIDTGMRRFGCMPQDATKLAQYISQSPHLELAAVMTHFAAADAPDTAFTKEQARRLDETCEAIRKSGVETPQVHMANSAATIRFPELHRDRVRIGIAMYGLQPDPDVALPASVHPVMTLHSRLSRVFTLEPGDTVSYGRTWTATERTRAGLVALGYADGYRRNGSNRYWMAVKGEKAPVRGRICMDQTVIAVPDSARAGDRVIVAGDGSDGIAPTLGDLADLIDTIPYEIATGLVAPRVPHLYVQDGKLVAIADLSGYRELVPDWTCSRSPVAE